MKARYVLPVIPKPKEGTASVLKFIGDGGINGSGNIDLLCGSCSHSIARGMGEGQMKNVVLQCPKCEAYNAVVDIPSIKHFISQLQAADLPPSAFPKFKKLLQEAITTDDGHKQLTEHIDKSAPEFSWFKQYLVPNNAGEVYGLLAFILAFITWYQTNFRVRNKEPQTINNNYYMGNDPYKGIGRNKKCPCGSGKKYKMCHGK